MFRLFPPPECRLRETVCILQSFFFFHSTAAQTIVTDQKWHAINAGYKLNKEAFSIASDRMTDCHWGSLDTGHPPTLDLDSGDTHLH